MPRTRAILTALAAASLTALGCGRESRPSAASSQDSTLVLRQRIAFLEGARSFGDGELQSRLQHPDARVRRAAAIALGRIQDTEAVALLVPLIDDPDSSVAEQAAFAIGQLQGYGDTERHAAQTPLVAKVYDRPLPGNVVFVEALGKVGGPEVVPVLEQSLATGLLSGMGSDARYPMLEGLAALGLARIKSAEARTLLVQVGDLRNRDVRAAWRIGAAMMADPDTAFYQRAVSLLDHGHPFARAQGARTLGRLGDARAFHPLAQHLADLDWKVRASILVAIAELADPRQPNREALDFCTSLTGDVHPLVREAAVAALDSFSVGARTPLLNERLEDAAPAVRLAAARALTRGSGAAPRQVWARARSDSVEFVRTGILAATRAVWGDAAALDTLRAVLQSSSVRQRTAAAEALSTLRSPGAPRAAVQALLVAALRDPDFVVAATAAEGLGTMRANESLPELAAAYDAHRTSHNDVDIRLAVVSAVRAMATHSLPDAARQLCERARGDADPRIAHAAAVGLAKLDGKPEPTAAPPHARAAVVRPDSLPTIDLGAVRVRLVTPRGEAVLELDGDRFPRTVGNFLQLVDAGFYAHGVFHRVVPAFVVQGGDPRGDGWGDAGRFLPCEYGDLRYDDAGVVGMAHAGKDTGGSQFFITHLPVPRLDGRYTAFGRVVSGMDAVDRIVRGDSFRIERVVLQP
jgi:cyclophilin family peptidyl-prolyl cis-trans isomerase/HEAT repeat protein